MPLCDHAADVELAVVNMSPDQKEPLSLTSIHHPLDDPNFDAVAYINKVFPDHESLTEVGPAITALKADIEQLDEKIVQTVRQQSRRHLDAHQHLESVQQCLKNLQDHMQQMKTQTSETVAAVKDACEDVRKLHWAKHNLTFTLVTLKKLAMFISAQNQLREAAPRKEYGRCRNLLLACQSLSTDLRDVPHVDTAGIMDTMVKDISQQLLEDFDTIFDPDQELVCNLHEACLCVDALSGKMRGEIVTHFSLQILESYKRIFQHPAEFSSLECIDRRFAWIRRAVNEYRGNFEGQVFPAAWNVEAHFVEHFCHVTRQHIVEALGRASVAPNALIRIIKQVSDFESGLVRTYQSEPVRQEVPISGEGLPHQSLLDGCTCTTEAELAPVFSGILLECFDASVGSIIKQEEHLLSAELKAAVEPGSDTVQDQPSGPDDPLPTSCYSSAIALFHSINVSLTKLGEVLSRTRLLDAFGVYRRLLSRYAETLKSRLQPSWRTATAVLNTCEFVELTLDDLERASLKYTDGVTFDEEKHLFWRVKAAGVELLLREAEEALSGAKSTFLITDWNLVEESVAASAYVGRLCQVVATFLNQVQESLSVAVFYFTADRLVQELLAFFKEQLQKLSDLSTAAQTRLAVDIGALEPGLLLAVRSALPKGAGVPLGLEKFLAREVKSILSLLRNDSTY